MQERNKFKIATLTFHWATNYGAVLQAYALQKYLNKNGYQTELIDYQPFFVQMVSWIRCVLHGKWEMFDKELKISQFRKRELSLSPKRYYSFKQLKKCKDEYEVIICGSDQIWNTNFTLTGENKPTLSYFLGFAGEKTKRIAYAVSIGEDKVPEEYIDIVAPEVQRFSAIGVRENSAVPIMNQLGVEAQVVGDPTLLLGKEDYNKLIENMHYDSDDVFTYILHDGQYVAHQIDGTIREQYRAYSMKKNNNIGLYEWLYKIKNAKMVVTNSFHGTMLSLIYNTPFVTVPVEGSAMNNRIVTILDAVGLSERIVSNDNKLVISQVCNKLIDWDIVNEKLKILREEGERFLLRNISDQEKRKGMC